MRQRVIDRLSAEPLSRGQIEMVDAALTASLGHRDALLADDHDIDALHPGRTVLILVDDARMVDAELLATAALLESVRLDMRVPAGLRVATGAGWASRGMPTPLDVSVDDLVEAMLALTGDELDVVLAERLDHARHLHLRPRGEWASGLAIEEGVYLGLASRRGGLLGRRYERWHRAFSARIARAG